ncbi:MAG TPA: NfeD family protein [Ruminococcaceae bacterium]|nr:NfeD family protein [Oscillospiraceae bacterium]
MEKELLQHMPYFWLAAAVFFGLLEAATVQLVAIWVCLGSVAAIVPAFFKASLSVQFAVFFAVSAAALILTRPFVKKVLKVKTEKTNADRVIGQTAIVIEDIDNKLSKGRVFVMGLDWAAYSVNSEKLEKGCEVKVTAIDGVKLAVEPLAKINN